MVAPLARFCPEERGMSGAEKALLICSALAVIALTGGLVRRGSASAARDAERALGQAGRGEAQLGTFQTVRAVAAPAEEVQRPRDGVVPGRVARAVREAPPPQAPQPPPQAPPPAIDFARLHNIADAANQALRTEWDRVRETWRRHIPDPREAEGWSLRAWRAGFRAFRFTVGVGFSGQAGLLRDLNRQVEDINARFAELDQIRSAMRNERDPARLRELGDRFTQRALELRDRIDRFRRDSGPFLTGTERAARAWEIGRDVYGLGTASNGPAALWNLGNLIRHTVGR